MAYKVPYFSFDKMNSDVEKDMANAFRKIFNSKWYIQGHELADFEKQFADYIGVKHAIGVGNGLDALKISLKVLNVGQGDEVILPCHTFIATLLAVLETGARPVLADVNPESYVLDWSNVEKHISRKSKVILPVHIYGFPCDLPELMVNTAGRDLVIVEDYAQAVGAGITQKKAGSFGRINAASFYPTKTLGAVGDGGIITTDDMLLANLCRVLRNYGFEKKGVHQQIGYNSRLDELQAAFLSMKMKFLDVWLAERESIANRYRNGLQDLPGIQLPVNNTKFTPAHHIFPILVEKRDQLKLNLEKAGIETLIHYAVPIHLQQSMAFLGYHHGSFPITERIAKTQLSLPIYPGLREHQIDYTIENIRKFMLNN